MEVFFRYKDTYFSSRLVNLSRGGLFMSSNILLTKGSPITIYLPNLGDSYEDLFETRGEVAWSSRGGSATNLPRGMGICFRDMKQRAAEQLDAYLIDAIHRQL
jgi:Tfp pilus assembly protein PilZ